MLLTILYGTQTGTAERLAYRIARIGLKRGITSVRCLPADDVPLERWDAMMHEKDAIFLFVVSNANQGEAPYTFRKTWARLLAPDAPQLDSMQYAVFGLGDSLYTKFNYTAKMLHNRLRQLGASPLLLRGLGDESDAKGIDETLLPWLSQLWTAMGLVPSGATVTSEDPLNASLFPLYSVRIAEDAAGDNNNKNSDNSECGMLATGPPPVYAEEDTFTCTVTANRRLTSAAHFQAVHHMELSVNDEEKTEGSSGEEGKRGALAKAAYEVGDALGVYCVNRPHLVEEMLSHMNLNGNERLYMEASNAHGIVEQTARPFLNRRMTARYFFTHYVDLDAVVDQELFWMLSFVVSPAAPDSVVVSEDGEDLVQETRERLLELANPIEVDGFLQYAHREKRNICEVLFDFNVSSVVKVRPPLDMLISFLAPMRPRLFSISSSPLMDPLPTLHLTIAQLAWQTPMKRQRNGLCSTILINAPEGFQLRCFIWQGALAVPPVPTPLLCIATGSGIAPMRALIRQCAARAREEEAWGQTPIYLFFGCRNQSMDYLYADEWEALKESSLSKLTVVPAFSRDTDKKVYVQHQLGQHSRLVGSLLREDAHAVVYVCGNAKQMPKDVHSVLVQIAEACVCDGDEDAAERFLKQILREGRYQVDTWSA